MTPPAVKVVALELRARYAVSAIYCAEFLADQFPAKKLRFKALGVVTHDRVLRDYADLDGLLAASPEAPRG